MKSAYLAGIGMPIIGALDTIGNTPITRRSGPVAETVCSTCGQCVLNYTGGICPLAVCPLQLKYGPCERFNEGNGLCVVDQHRYCVWEKISQVANMEELAKAHELHQREFKDAVAIKSVNRTRPWVRKVSGWIMTHSGWMEKAALSIR